MSITAAQLKVDVIADTTDAERGVGNFGDKLNSTAKNLAATGTGLSLAVTAPLLGIAKAGLDSAMEFEANLNVLQQVVGATQSEMESMQAEALRLGAVTSFSAGEASAAMLELGKAGMGTEDIMGSIAGVMDLAAAGGIGLAQAAGITANAINAFGLQAEDASRIANLFAGAANASSADVADLAIGVQNAGFAFAAAGWPIEDLAASLAILTNVGLTGADASTALKNAIMQMISPTQQAKDQAAALGVSFFDAAGTMLPLATIVDDLNEAFVGMSDEQRNAALATMFMSDGMKAMIPLLDQGGAGLEDMVATVSEAGQASETAAARMAGLSGAIEYFKGSVDSFLIGAGLPFLDTLSGIVRTAADGLTAFGELPAPIMNAALAFAAVLAAAGPLMLAFSGLAAGIAFLISPVGLLIVASAALAAAWAANVGGIQGITANALGQTQQLFMQTEAAANAFAASVSTAFSNTTFPTLDQLWTEFQAGDFSAIAEQIKSTAFELMVNLDAELNITGRATQLRDQLMGIVAGIQSEIAGIDFSSAATGFQTLRQNIEAGLASALSGINFAPAQSAFDQVRATLSGGLTAISMVAQTFDLGSTISLIQTSLSNVRDNILTGLTTAFEGADWSRGGATFAGMINDLSTGISSLDFSAINWAEVFKNRLLGPIGTAIRGIEWIMGSEAFGPLKTAVTDAITTIDWGAIGTALVGLGTAITTAVNDVFTDMVTDVTAAINGVDWATGSLDFAGMINSVTEKINSINWSTVGSDLVTSISAAMTSLFSGDTTVADNFGAAVRGALTAIDWSAIGTALVGLDGALKAAFAGLIGGALAEIGAGLNDFTVSLPIFDWADYIVGDLTWTDFIEILEWVSYLDNLDWTTFVALLSWPDWIASLTWGDFIGALEWVNFIVSLDWATWIVTLSWDAWIGELSWGSFIGSFTWSDFIPSFHWSDFVSSFSVPGFAAGTSSAPGGLAMVGERGPELVELPRRSRVYSDRETSAIVAGAGGVTMHVHIGSINSELDIHEAAATLAREFQRRSR